jgi:hypothetical protein
LTEGENAQPANYRGCKHAKEEMPKKKLQATPKHMSGRVFSYNPVKPHLSFAAALRCQGNQPPHKEAPAASFSEPPATKANVQKACQSVQAPTVNGGPLEMFRAISVVEKIMAELKDAASEEDKFLSVAKIVFKLMKQNGK